MRTFVIFTDFVRFQPHTPFYERYYRIMDRLSKERDIQIVFAVSYDYRCDTRTFSHGYILSSDGYEEVHDIRPDGIWYKSNRVNYLTYRIFQDYSDIFSNPIDFSFLTRDKYLTAKTFPDISPATYSAEEVLESPELRDTLTDPYYIVKPDSAYGGKGVTKVARTDLETHLRTRGDDPIVQTFIDSSCGIPGLVEGVHDLRVNMVGGVPQSLLLRTPNHGDFRCNVDAKGK